MTREGETEARHEWRSLLRARSEFSSDRAVERPSAAAADEKEQRTEADQQRVFRAALRPEEPLRRGEFHAHDHEDDDGRRRKARKQSQHQQDAAINSVQPPSVPQNRPGVKPSRSNSAALPAKPMPPNAPNSFCMPWGMRIAPSAMRRIGSAYSLTAS